MRKIAPLVNQPIVGVMVADRLVKRWPTNSGNIHCKYFQIKEFEIIGCGDYFVKNKTNLLIFQFFIIAK